MNEFESIKHIMMSEHMTYDELSALLGYKSHASAYQRLNGKHIYVDTWLKILEKLGYEVTIRRKDGTGGEIIVADDNIPSPLRFKDMNLNFDKILSEV